MKRIYLLAGEASGDLHGAALVTALLRQQPGLILRGWGGDEMAAAGCTIAKHYRELAFMGFVEVMRNLPAIRRNFAFARKDIASFNPDVVVMIDYPGFNMRLLPWVKSKGIRVVYYIAPQVWAWHQSRVKTLRRYVDELLVILPFEAAFFARHGIQARFVGHPLAARIAGFQADPDFHQRYQLDPEKPLIALLPGSRKQEISGMLPVMMKLIPHFPQFQWVIAMAPAQPEERYKAFIPPGAPVTLIRQDTYNLLAGAHAALVTSGTATLETALFRVPQVVLYRGNPVSYQIARRLIKVAYISLVNLLLDRPLVSELIQGELHEASLTQAFRNILDPRQRTELAEGYQQLHTLLQGQDASAQAAAWILKAE